MSAPRFCQCWLSLNTGTNGECENCGLVRILPTDQDKETARELADILAGPGSQAHSKFEQQLETVARRIGEIRSAAAHVYKHRLKLQPRFCDMVIGLPEGMSIDDVNTGFNASLRSLAVMIKAQEEKP